MGCLLLITLFSRGKLALDNADFHHKIFFFLDIMSNSPGILFSWGRWIIPKFCIVTGDTRDDVAERFILP